MNKVKALIIDDELHARRALRGMIEDNLNEIELVGEAKNLPEGVKLIRKLQPQIVFLDVEMPEYSGLEIMDFFAQDEINFQIIFVTAYSDYAINAFELSALDYLIKPLQLEQLKKAVAKVPQASGKSVETLKQNLDDNSPKRLVLWVNGYQELFNLEDIIYIKADGSYCDVILKDRKICVSKRLSDFERLQEFGPFLRIHRSHMINLLYVHKISKAEIGTLFMIDGAELSISKEKRSALDEMVERLKI